ncbi:hypothetical protein LLG90_10925 [Aromatoleum toluclasticum]|uniref:COG3904 family protein n=1 Tax=Aromatoleum toluclasticum TaxID=92003 RepID=UPI001D17E0C7|nr:hypothetical protein [Aromatoleum toluclasticum]MCC4115862.1 hypothetical protein [Aromatoleum toluclasticum]
MHVRFPRHLLAAAATGLVVAACGVAPTVEPKADAKADHFTYQGGDVATAQRGTDCELALRGALTPAAVSSLRLASDALAKRSCQGKTVVLDLADGSVGAAITVGSMLRNRGFDTRIASGSTCHTLCLLVFAAGTRREIAPNARLGFSQIPPDEDFGRANCDTELDNRQMLNLARYLRAMLPGLTADYMLQQIRATDCRSVRPLPASDAITAGLATKG